MRGVRHRLRFRNDHGWPLERMTYCLDPPSAAMCRWYACAPSLKGAMAVKGGNTAHHGISGIPLAGIATINERRAHRTCSAVMPLVVTQCNASGCVCGNTPCRFIQMIHTTIQCVGACDPTMRAPLPLNKNNHTHSVCARACYVFRDKCKFVRKKRHVTSISDDIHFTKIQKKGMTYC